MVERIVTASVNYSEYWYYRRFAFWPVRCKCNWVLFKTYYKKYHVFCKEGFREHDFVECVTEADFIVEKLSENN